MARSGSLRTTGLGRVPSSGGLRPVIPRSHAIAAASSLECASPSSSKDNHPDARSRQTLHPDVFLGDCAVAPFRDGHHPAAAFELSDHARPLSGSEFDRVGRDLDGCATGGLDERPHGIDVLLESMGLGLPVDIYKNVVGMVVGEHAMPVGAVPSTKSSSSMPFRLRVTSSSAITVASFLTAAAT